MVRTKQQRKRNRRKADPATFPPPATLSVLSVAVASGNALVTLNGTIQLVPGSVPSTWEISGNPVTSIVSSTSNSLTVATGHTITSGNAYGFSAYDPAVRTPSGGYVAAATGTVAP